MPIITEGGTEAWTNFSVRIPPELAREVEQYAEDTGEEIMSNALRMLIAGGLEQKKRGDIHTERTIISNAKAFAVNKLDIIVQAVIGTFNDSELEDIVEEEDEEGEEDEE